MPSKDDRFFDANEDFSADLTETQPDAGCAAAPGITAPKADHTMLHTVQHRARMDAPSATHSPSVGLAVANASVRMRLAASPLPSSRAAPRAHSPDLRPRVFRARPKSVQALDGTGHW